VRKWIASQLARIRPGDGSAGEKSATENLASLDALQLYSAGRHEEAQMLAAERLRSDPTHVPSLVVQAYSTLDEGSCKKSIDLFEKTIQLDPECIGAWIGLGRARHECRLNTGALAAFKQAAQLNSRHPLYLTERALLAIAAGNPEEAASLLDQTRADGPRRAEALFQLGNHRREQARVADALQLYRQAVEASPSHANATANLGALLKDEGQFAEAEAYLEKALSLQPRNAQAAYNLATLLFERKRATRAPEVVELLRRSLEVDPKQADAYEALGDALLEVCQPVEARRAYEMAVRLNQSSAEPRWALAMAQLPVLSRSTEEKIEGVAAFDRELEKLRGWYRTHNPANGFFAVGTRQPFYLAYVEQNHRDVLRKYGGLCSSLMARWAGAAVRDAVVGNREGKLRVGIVSAHVCDHSVWHAITRGWVDYLDPSKFELEIFHTGVKKDALTSAAAKRCSELHFGLGDWRDWAKAISNRQFDILLYPELGMDSTACRLAAMRLATKQAVSWGHPVTSGMPTMDAYISAAAFEPADAPSHYTERLIALPRLGCAYRPFDTKPECVDISVWGISAEERLLLCAGHPIKYGPGEDSMLVEIARRCSPCKLVFFNFWGDFKAQLLKERLAEAFASAGLDFDEYVRFIPFQPQPAFFGLLHRADVFLDTIAFSGFNTAMQAVECNTPIVAWQGKFMRGRLASGVMHEMGMSEWIAETKEQFVSLVEQLCSDPGLRSRVRQQIRERKRALFNDKQSVEALGNRLEELVATA
jgi:protein O-GlcNAc transferase